MSANGTGPVQDEVATLKPPLAMLAELTHRCPLQCPYCSNPVELVRRSSAVPRPGSDAKVSAKNVE